MEAMTSNYSNSHRANSLDRDWLAVDFSLLGLLLVCIAFVAINCFAQAKSPINLATPSKKAECFNRINEHWNLVTLRDLSFCSPFEASFTDVKGIDLSFKRYRGKEGTIDIYSGPNSPRISGVEQQLSTYKEKSEWINNIWAYIWQYKDETGNLGYVAGARFYLENRADGDGVLVFLSSTNVELQNQSEKIFKSVRFNANNGSNRK